MSNRDQNNRLAESAFIAIQNKRGLRIGEGSRPVLFNDLMAYLNGSEYVDNPSIEQELSRNLVLRKQFNELIASQRVGFCDALAMADSGDEIKERLSEHFELYFKTDIANNEQVYVLLTITSPELLVDKEEAKPVVILEKENSCMQVAFPPLYGSSSQIILTVDDEQLRWLRDPEACMNLLLR